MTLALLISSLFKVITESIDCCIYKDVLPTALLKTNQGCIDGTLHLDRDERCQQSAAFHQSDIFHVDGQGWQKLPVPLHVMCSQFSVPYISATSHFYDLVQVN